MNIHSKPHVTLMLGKLSFVIEIKKAAELSYKFILVNVVGKLRYTLSQLSIEYLRQKVGRDYH
jgi:hypothetical protein